ncbi:MAG: ferritin-like domain-containing protein, partial [Planctomycetota bacterium]|nr:ferritin-like domain-containing protein [Planctomycetota bacterium]
MPASNEQNEKIINALCKAYNAELETVMNYIANSVNLDGVHADPIKSSLQTDITEELSHAQMLAKRIKTIGGIVPGSQKMKMTQEALQPSSDTTDVVAVIKGVIAAEEAAIAGYEEIIKMCDGVDFVTQDLAISLLADEQEHRREFLGFLKEYG